MYIDIKNIKMFDCLQCLNFPSMCENDEIRLISIVHLILLISLRMCEQQIWH